MQTMHIDLVSLEKPDEAGHIVARAIAVAPDAGAQLWIEVRFEPANPHPRDEAYDRILELLDVA